mmetsp:Transcript_23866/g.50610  ORF Transcript_23866/g.50610 Transcript_23866/m.50610 type:complete len:233 (+) Transcript_23866:557-1255(+)
MVSSLFQHAVIKYILSAGSETSFFTAPLGKSKKNRKEYCIIVALDNEHAMRPSVTSTVSTPLRLTKDGSLSGVTVKLGESGAVASNVSGGSWDRMDSALSCAWGENWTWRGSPSLAPEAAHSGGMAVSGVRPTVICISHCTFSNLDNMSLTPSPGPTTYDSTTCSWNAMLNVATMAAAAAVVILVGRKMPRTMRRGVFVGVDDEEGGLVMVVLCKRERMRVVIGPMLQKWVL